MDRRERGSKGGSEGREERGTVREKEGLSEYGREAGK